MKIKRYLSRYLGMGLAVLLMAAALFAPQLWFMLRDAATVDDIHGEILSPLVVAQLNRSYEHDIHDRMAAYMRATALNDVMCSSKEVDPGSESLWENIEQAQRQLLMEALWGREYMRYPFEYDAGTAITIKSCTQYVLMRKSDGQILLVANDILLDRGDGCRTELLIDGVDGTIYYLESEENNSIPSLRPWGQDWWWLLNNAYQTEEALLLDDEFANISNLAAQEDYTEVFFYDADGEEVNYYGTRPQERAKLEIARQVWVWDYAGMNIWISASTKNNDATYCCLLAFGEISDSWAMEIEEKGEPYWYRIRLGLPGVVNRIPEMAQRISLAEYDMIYELEKE